MELGELKVGDEVAVQSMHHGNWTNYYLITVNKVTANGVNAGSHGGNWYHLENGRDLSGRTLRITADPKVIAELKDAIKEEIASREQERIA